MNLTPEQEHDVDAAAHRVLELSDRLRRLDKRINTYYVMLDTLESQRKQTKKGTAPSDEEVEGYR
jgi:hypothetical protein